MSSQPRLNQISYKYWVKSLVALLSLILIDIKAEFKYDYLFTLILLWSSPRIFASKIVIEMLFDDHGSMPSDDDNVLYIYFFLYQNLGILLLTCELRNDKKCFQRDNKSNSVVQMSQSQYKYVDLFSLKVFYLLECFICLVLQTV